MIHPMPTRKRKPRTVPSRTPTRRHPKPEDLAHYPPKLQAACQELNIQEYQFVCAYVGRARGNGTLAAQIAGIGGGYASQASRASILLQLPHVRRALDAWMQAFGMTAAELTWQLKDLCDINMGPFVQWQADGTLQLKTPDEETWQAHRHWIKEIETDPKSGKIMRVQLHDAMVARKEMAKILKLYSDAPIFLFHMHLQQLSDAELLQQLSEARSEADPALAHQEPIAILPPPDTTEETDGE